MNEYQQEALAQMKWWTDSLAWHLRVDPTNTKHIAFILETIQQRWETIQDCA